MHQAGVLEEGAGGLRSNPRHPACVHLEVFPDLGVPRDVLSMAVVLSNSMCMAWPSGCNCSTLCAVDAHSSVAAEMEAVAGAVYSVVNLLSGNPQELMRNLCSMQPVENPS